VSKTILGITGAKIIINGQLTYSDISGTKVKNHGLLMNARFIQGIFDDKADVSRFSRLGISGIPIKIQLA